MTRLQTCRNLALVGKNKLTVKVSTKGTSISISASAQISALAQVFIPALGQMGMYTNMNLEKVTKLGLELFIKGQKHDKL